MLAALARTSADWAGALALYAWGSNSPWQDMTQARDRFADN